MLYFHIEFNHNLIALYEKLMSHYASTCLQDVLEGGRVSWLQVIMEQTPLWVVCCFLNENTVLHRMLILYYSTNTLNHRVVHSQGCETAYNVWMSEDALNEIKMMY
jgi:hypothetical protein